jgi:HEAT repeat protein
VSSRLLEYHLSRLKDKSPQARINAIQELVHIGDTSVLEALQEVFKNDPDEEVRRTAQKAGRELFLKARAAEEKSED